MRGQADLFPGLDDTATPIQKPVTSDIRIRPQSQKQAFRLDPANFEPATHALEASGRYRVLRRLPSRPVVTSRIAVPGEKLAVIVDTETTGLDHTRDEVIEIGMLKYMVRAGIAVEFGHERVAHAASCPQTRTLLVREHLHRPPLVPSIR